MQDISNKRLMMQPTLSMEQSDHFKRSKSLSNLYSIEAQIQYNKSRDQLMKQAPNDNSPLENELHSNDINHDEPRATIIPPKQHRSANTKNYSLKNLKKVCLNSKFQHGLETLKSSNCINSKNIKTEFKDDSSIRTQNNEDSDNSPLNQFQNDNDDENMGDFIQLFRFLPKNLLEMDSKKQLYRESNGQASPNKEENAENKPKLSVQSAAYIPGKIEKVAQKQYNTQNVISQKSQIQHQIGLEFKNAYSENLTDCRYQKPQNIESPMSSTNYKEVNILSGIKDQNQSRCLQVLAEDSPYLVKNVMLPQLLNNFEVLCNDPFANYLVQKMIDLLDPLSLKQIASSMIMHFNNLCLHNFGSRIIQKLIELKDQNLLDLLSGTINCFLPILYTNANGLHIVTKFLKSSQKFHFVFDFINTNLVSICTDKNGSCMIQKILEEHPELEEYNVSYTF